MVKKAISLKDAKFVTENNAELADLDAFVIELQKYANGVEVQYSKDSEGKVTFKIVRALIGGTAADKVLVDKYVTELTGAKISVTGLPTTLATTTIDSAQLDVAGKTLEINGVKFERHNNASPEQLGYFSDLNDLANKINKNANIKVKAEVLAGNVLQLTDAINGKFEYTLNGNKLLSTSGTVGVDQEITFTFTSAFNVATGDKVTVNGSTTGTVASVSSDKKTVVVKFTGTGIAAATTVNTFAVVDKTSSNTITGTATIQLP